LGGNVAVLPHDSGIANEEQVRTVSRLGPFADLADEDAGKELFKATLAWIAESFPVQKEDAENTRLRM